MAGTDAEITPGAPAAKVAAGLAAHVADAAKHREINDSGSAADELLSSAEVDARIVDAFGWVAAAAYANSPTEIIVSDTEENRALFAAGKAIRHRASASGSWVYGVVRSYTAGAIVYSGGPHPPTNVCLLEGSRTPRTVVIEGAIPGRFADAASTSLLEDDDLQLVTWGHGAAYLVQLAVVSGTDDSGASQPHVGVTVGGAQVCTENGNQGPECVDTGWTDSGVALKTANYGVALDDAIEITTDAAGSNNDSADLSFRLIFVLE